MKFHVNKNFQSWGYSLVAERLLSLGEVLGSTPSA